MNRFLLNIIVVCLPVVMFSQSSVQVHIQWSELMTARSSNGNNLNYYSFEDATNLFEFGVLPVYHTDYQLPSEYFGCELEIKVLDRDTISLSSAEMLTDIDLIGLYQQYRIEYSGLTSHIYILPFQRLETGEIIRFLDFKIFIDLVPTGNGIQAADSPPDYTETSVLNSGTWFKMGIVNTGVHKLSFADLVAFGIDPTQLDPKKIGVFGNYNGMLPENNSYYRNDDLQENSIIIVGEEDGKFDEDDYILFYAQSATTWRHNLFTGRFDHSKNLYADTSYYFLSTDAGHDKRIQTISGLSDEPTETANSFYDYTAHENDLVNLMHSGKQWFGEKFTGNTIEQVFSFDFPNLKTDRPVYLSFDMVARAFINTYVEVYVNNIRIIDSVKFDKISTNGSKYASQKGSKVTFFADDEKLDVKVRFISDDPTAIAWLNFIELNAERELIFPGGQMEFRNPRISASGNITRFEIDEVSNGVRVWDITDKFNPVEIECKLTDNKLDFTLHTDSIREFIMLDETIHYLPVNVHPVQNQNLHGINNVNFVIVSPEIFLPQAERLAKLHEEMDGLKSVVVTADEIYNEFSSGSQDVSAIRDFMRMLWVKQAFGNEPAYVLLFGDASFDYKYRIHENTNVIPTYQSKESLRETQSFVSDDYFGLLEEDEGKNCRGTLDIGVGRFPVSTLEDAIVAVDKVEHYMGKNGNVMRSWRNTICFIADDADHNLHMHQAKYLINTTDTVQPVFNLNKIFSDAYTKIKVPGGKRYPDVNKRINQQVNEGALIINYTGHGGLIGWSEELILDVPTIRSYDNLDNMPLFITATCEFSRFDNPEFVSAGEYLYLNKKGGAIALLTTTRLAFAAANIIVNQRIYEHLMERGDGERPRLGDMVRLSKIPSNDNFLNFVLLGDPALRLAYPQYDVITTAVNNNPMNGSADTVHALSLVSVTGSIIDHEGNKMEHFNGYVYPKVFDKASEYMTLGTEIDSSPEEFDLMDKVLFNGKTSVVNGVFSFSFLVPKDIIYRYGFGKVSYYALDTTKFIDAWGAYEHLLIGGVDEQFEPDNTGPEITLYFNDKSFESGDEIPQNSNFYAELFDNNGIYSTGHSLGRDITLIMDEEMANTMIMNEYFTPDLDTYKSGKLSYKFNGLADGWHILTLKAWDLQNNSSDASIDFYVDKNAEILLSNVMNYPNPFTSETYFGFVHNKYGTILDIKVNIYDINGRFVSSIEDQVGPSVGQSSALLKWDGKDQNGNPLPSGLYTYHIIVTDYTGNKSIQRQKMIKLNE